MKSLLKILFIIILFQSCSKDSQDQYYVKYIIESTSSNLNQKNYKLITTINDEFGKAKEVKHNTGGKWELTIGPVKKGFNSQLSTKSVLEDITNPLMPANAKMNLKIEDRERTTLNFIYPSFNWRTSSWIFIIYNLIIPRKYKPISVSVDHQTHCC